MYENPPGTFFNIEVIIFKCLILYMLYSQRAEEIFWIRYESLFYLSIFLTLQNCCSTKVIIQKKGSESFKKYHRPHVQCYLMSCKIYFRKLCFDATSINFKAHLNLQFFSIFLVGIWCRYAFRCASGRAQEMAMSVSLLLSPLLWLGLKSLNN